MARYRFGLFALDVAGGLLAKNGVGVKLQDQPLQLLALLLERNPETVSREEIRQRLWQGKTFVDFDKSLSVAVLTLAKSMLTRLRSNIEADVVVVGSYTLLGDGEKI